MKILVIAPWLLKPDRSAGDLRLHVMLKALAARHSVDCVAIEGWPGSPDYARYRALLESTGVRFLPSRWQGIERAMCAHSYDLGLFEFWPPAHRYAGLFRKLQPWARTVVDTVDVHFLRETAGLAYGLSDPELVERRKAQEIEAYRRADAIVVVSEEDKQALLAYPDIPPAVVIPVVAPERRRERVQRAKTLLFVGGFKHPPNVDGITWFAEFIWPQVLAAVTNARLTVVGSDPPAEVSALSALPGIEVVGYVPDLGPFFDRAAVSVAPLRFGGGMKGKVAEAMAAGLPVVTTPIGVQGFGDVSGRYCLVEEEPADFARAVIDLLQAPEKAGEMGLAGQRYISGLCGEEAIDRELQKLVASVTAGAADRSGADLRLLARRTAYAGAGAAHDLIRVTGILPLLKATKERLSGGGRG